MDRTRTAVAVTAAALCVGVAAPWAAAAPAGARPQVNDAQNDADQEIEAVGRLTEGTLDILSAAVTSPRPSATARRGGAVRDDLRVDLRLAYYPSSTSGVVYRVSGAAPGLCGKDDARVVVESVMAATGWRHQLITPCASAPLALQTEVRRDGFTWTVPASALPRELRSGTRLTDLRADSGWVQHYFDYAGVVRGYGAYEAADQATGRATVVLR